MRVCLIVVTDLAAPGIKDRVFIMITFTIDARFIRAAQNATAKNDVRYYLNGFHLRTDGTIEATDGHILYQGKYTDHCELTEPMVITIDGKIPASADTVTFNFEEGARQGQCRTNKGKLFAVDLIDGKFPDCDRVIPGERAIYTNGLAMDPAQLIRIGQIAGTKEGQASLVMTHGTEHESALFTFGMGIKDKKPVPLKDPYAASFKAVLMPVRVGNEFLQSGLVADRKAA